MLVIIRMQQRWQLHLSGRGKKSEAKIDSKDMATM